MTWRTPNTKKKLISGYFYHKMCKWSICPRYHQSFIPEEVLENDLVFLNIDYFESFCSNLNRNPPNSKFVLVTQNSDRDFTQEMIRDIGKYTNKIYAINCSAADDKIIKIPIGFNDHATETIESEEMSMSQKQNLIYVNFKLQHHKDRDVCFDYFKKLEWVDIESEILPLEVFYSKLKTFKYCVCPRGTGIDTHRVYESLFFGVIPIVKKSELDEMYEKLPILIVERWEDIDYKYLTDNYEENIIKYQRWLEKNSDWIDPSYWIKK